MKSDTVRNTYAATADLHTRWQTLKHPIVWSLVLSAGLHAALFAGADRLHPSDPMPLALATDMQAVITIESQVMGSEITRVSAASHSESLEPALSAMQSQYKRLRQALDSQTQNIVVMKQRNRLQASRIEKLQRKEATITRDNSRLRHEITRQTRSQKALQAQHKELTLSQQTTLAQNAALHQTSSRQEQAHRAQVEKHQQLKSQALSQTNQIAAAKERETLIKLDHTRLTESVATLEASNYSLRNATWELESSKQLLEDAATENTRQNNVLRAQLAAISTTSGREEARHKNELEQVMRKLNALTKHHTAATRLADALRAELKTDQSNRTEARDATRAQLALAHTENKQLRAHHQQTTDQVRRASITEKKLKAEIERLEKMLPANATLHPTPTTRTPTTVTASPPLGNALSNHQPRQVAGNPKPVYPSLAIKRRLQGDVMLTVSIQPTGAVSKVTLKRGSGFKLLDNAAMDAVRHWRYEPLPETALPESRSDDIPVNFRLGSKT
jgi:TonB family protein